MPGTFMCRLYFATLSFVVCAWILSMHRLPRAAISSIVLHIMQVFHLHVVYYPAYHAGRCLCRYYYRHSIPSLLLLASLRGIFMCPFFVICASQQRRVLCPFPCMPCRFPPSVCMSISPALNAGCSPSRLPIAVYSSVLSHRAFLLIFCNSGTIFLFIFAKSALPL